MPGTPLNFQTETPLLHQFLIHIAHKQKMPSMRRRVLQNNLKFELSKNGNGQSQQKIL